MTATMPRSLQGDHEALAIPDLRTFGVGSAAGLSQGNAAMGTAAGFESL